MLKALISFPEPKMTSSNVMFCPQSKDIHFTVIKDKGNHKIFTFRTLKLHNFEFLSLQNSLSFLLKPINRLLKW